MATAANEGQGVGVFLSITARTGDGPDEPPATDVGHLLHKHPERVHTAATTGGSVHVLYPVATATECTVAVVLDIDPLDLGPGGAGRRGRGRAPGGEGAGLGEYVNDRPYAATSLLAVALGAVFRTAMAGRCRTRPELVDRLWDLRVDVPALPSGSRSGAPDLVEHLFAPLGWQVDARPVPLDTTRPDWGDSPYVTLVLTGTQRIADALAHLYVLLPVLDGIKHYWVGDDEVDKLLRAGERWLPRHPERELITRRYLAHQGGLVRAALARLADVDDTPAEALDDAVPDDAGSEAAGSEAAGSEAAGSEAAGSEAAGSEAAGSDAAGPGAAGPEAGGGGVRPLVRLRHEAVLAAVTASGARRVIDWGCGDGALLRHLLALPQLTEIVGVDVSSRALEIAARRLRLDRLPENTAAERLAERVRLLQSSLTYTDARLRGYDAAVLMEVVEHVDAERLPALEHAVFGAARPGTVVVTTPNVEHNVRYGLRPGQLRHPDHRFEWTRAEVAAWTGAVADRYGYAVGPGGVGDDDPEVGPPTQLAVLTREGAA